jgi:hypothetical protein
MADPTRRAVDAVKEGTFISQHPFFYCYFPFRPGEESYGYKLENLQ